MYDYDASALSDELIETITIAEGVTSLMTNTLPYQTSITFSGSSSTSAINFSWLN